MTRQQMYDQASVEWHRSEQVRRHYPTFVFYWQERYARVYNFDVNLRDRLSKQPH